MHGMNLLNTPELVDDMRTWTVRQRLKGFMNAQVFEDTMAGLERREAELHLSRISATSITIPTPGERP